MPFANEEKRRRYDRERKRRKRAQLKEVTPTTAAEVPASIDTFEGQLWLLEFGVWLTVNDRSSAPTTRARVLVQLQRGASDLCLYRDVEARIKELEDRVASLGD